MALTFLTNWARRNRGEDKRANQHISLLSLELLSFRLQSPSLQSPNPLLGAGLCRARESSELYGQAVRLESPRMSRGGEVGGGIRNTSPQHSKGWKEAQKPK